MTIEPTLHQQVSAVREFNRFYTAQLGLLRRRHLDGEFSLTEARILYEIGANPKMTASSLCATLQLDAGYISRLLAALTRRKLLRQTRSKVDGREKLLMLSAAGQSEVDRLNEKSNAQIRGILARVSAKERAELVASLSRACTILAEDQTRWVRIVRLTAPNKDAFDILEEYYEAVDVVKRDKPESIRKIFDEATSGMWLAYLGGEVVGCVVLRRLESISRASECKRLYVKPAMRGKRIGDKLLDAMEDYARSCEVEWIYLDSYDALKTAIALYERRGYARCERYNDNPQATLFMRKQIA